MVDWTAIRSGFEQGASQRSLAREFGVTQPTISERAKKEGWQHTTNPLPIIPLSEPISDRETHDLLSVVSTLLQKVALHAQSNLEPKDIKLLADALSQFHKIKITTPQQDQDFSAFDMREFLAECTDEELAIVKPIIAAVQARREEKITPLRRTG
jgi:hypothetical protein